MSAIGNRPPQRARLELGEVATPSNPSYQAGQTPIARIPIDVLGIVFENLLFTQSEIFCMHVCRTWHMKVFAVHKQCLQRRISAWTPQAAAQTTATTDQLFRVMSLSKLKAGYQAKKGQLVKRSRSLSIRASISDFPNKTADIDPEIPDRIVALHSHDSHAMNYRGGNERTDTAICAIITELLQKNWDTLPQRLLRLDDKATLAKFNRHFLSECLMNQKFDAYCNSPAWESERGHPAAFTAEQIAHQLNAYLDANPDSLWPLTRAHFSPSKHSLSKRSQVIRTVINERLLQAIQKSEGQAVRALLTLILQLNTILSSYFLQTVANHIRIDRYLQIFIGCLANSIRSGEIEWFISQPKKLGSEEFEKFLAAIEHTAFSEEDPWNFEALFFGCLLMGDVRAIRKEVVRLQSLIPDERAQAIATRYLEILSGKKGTFANTEELVILTHVLKKRDGKRIKQFIASRCFHQYVSDQRDKCPPIKLCEYFLRHFMEIGSLDVLMLSIQESFPKAPLFKMGFARDFTNHLQRYSLWSVGQALIPFLNFHEMERLLVECPHPQNIPYLIVLICQYYATKEPTIHHGQNMLWHMGCFYRKKGSGGFYDLVEFPLSGLEPFLEGYNAYGKDAKTHNHRHIDLEYARDYLSRNNESWERFKQCNEFGTLANFLSACFSIQSFS